jgi:hypothetical protein
MFRDVIEMVEGGGERKFSGEHIYIFTIYL